MKMLTRIKGLFSWNAGATEMNRTDLTYRLRQVGMSKPEFAAKMGLAAETVYQWAEVPDYAVALLDAIEKIFRLEETIAGLRNTTNERKISESVEKKRNPGQFQPGNKLGIQARKR